MSQQGIQPEVPARAEAPVLGYEAPPTRAARASWRLLLNEHVALVLVLLALVGIFGAISPSFLRFRMFRIMAGQVPTYMILSVGMTYVLIIAGIDLSIGWVLVLGTAVLVNVVLAGQLPISIAIPAAIGVGLLCGLINGAFVVVWRLPSFIVTLGMLQCAWGVTTLLVPQTASIRESGINWLNDTRFGGIPLTFYIALTIVVGGQLVLSRTVFGRYMVALGTNEEALRLSGVDPRPVKLAVFAICGLLTGVAAVMDTARTQCADPTSGTGIELDVIAAVVIGGTSLMGGRGSVISSFLGVLVLTVVQRGLTSGSVSFGKRLLLTGSILVAAVILDYYRNRLGRRTSS